MSLGFPSRENLLTCAVNQDLQLTAFCPMAIFTPVTTGTAEQLENTEVKARQKRWHESLDDIVIPSNDREIHHLTKLRCVDR